MKHISTLLCTILLCLTAGNTKAQTASNDSISVETLFQAIESNGQYRIFTDITQSFDVPNYRVASVGERLTKAFEGTPYVISILGNNIFVLKERKLETNYSTSLSTKKSVMSEETGLFASTEQSQKATSENLVYTIGDKHTKQLPEAVTIFGKITDSKTGEALVQVNIVDKESNIQVSSDDKGNYIMTLPAGRRQVDISRMNIKDSRRQLMLYGDGEFNIELVEESFMLGEVTVFARRSDNVRNTNIGVDMLRVSNIKNIPTALGEVDLLKAIQTLPGVKTVGEASSGFNVRGGATDQNLILLNEGTIYNPNHLFGFFTAFSSDMIKEAEIYKSSIPSQYGGRISSVLDISVKEADKEKFSGSAGIGLVTSKLNIETPIVKGKTSLLFSGRTTYSDWILKALPESSGYNDGSAGFYDLGLNISHRINTKNTVNVFGYYSHDRFSFDANNKYAYKNMNASAKWKSILGEKFIGNFTVGVDHYDYENIESSNPASAYRLSFAINQVFAKADFSYKLNKHQLSFGAKSMLYDIQPGTFAPYGTESLTNYDRMQNEKAIESAVYIGDEWDITPRLSVNGGIRFSLFNAMGPRSYYEYAPGALPYVSTIIDTVNVGSGKSFNTYGGPEYRLSARYIIGDNLSVKAGYNSMRQYIHKLSNTVIMSPTDTWKLSDANVKPQKGWQAATGLYLNTTNREWEFSVEGYYKEMDDYLDYRSGAQLIMNHHVETDVINTEGYAYGTELAIKKTAGKLNGWVSYTYSRTFLRQNGDLISNPVNDGDWYPTDYDKPHDFKFIGNYKITQRHSFSMNIDYSTGRPTTIPAGKYYNPTTNSTQVYYTERNSYRIPDYFRMDVSYNMEPNHKLTLLTHSTISIGVYNITARKNVYSIYFVSEGGKIQGYQMSIFGTAIPFITYNIKF